MCYESGYTFFSGHAEVERCTFAQRSLHHIVNVASDVFENPIFLIDHGFRLITKSDEVVDDAIWNDLTQSGYYSYDNLKLAKSDKRYTTIIQSKSPVYIHIGEKAGALSKSDQCKCLQLDEKTLNHSRLVLNLYAGAKRLGSITVIEYRSPLEPYHIKLLEHLSKIILVQMNLTPAMLDVSGANALGNIMDDIMFGKITNDTDLQERFSFFHITPKKYFFILSVRQQSHDDSTSDVDLNHYQTILIYLLNNFNTLIYEDAIVFVLNTDDKTLYENRSFDYKKLHDLSKILKENNLAGGISNSFESLLDIQDYYTQAKKALRFGSLYGAPSQCLSRYGDFIFEDVMDTLCKTGFDPDTYYHPAFTAMTEADAAGCTGYTETILAYLHHFNNMQAAANELHVHRNTLAYRLNKIQEQFNVDLNDAKMLFHLFMSFELARYTDRK